MTKQKWFNIQSMEYIQSNTNPSNGLRDSTEWTQLDNGFNALLKH